MRTIQTKGALEKRKKTNTTIISLSILALLLFSTVGFAFITSPNDSSEDGNYDDFYNASENKVESKLNVDYQGQTIYLSSYASDIENIQVDIEKIPEDYSGKTLYISSDNAVVLKEISLMGRISSRIQEACYGPCEENLPEKTCKGEDNLIILNYSSEEKVWQEENCIFIEGGIKAVDAFIYNLFETELQSSL